MGSALSCASRNVVAQDLLRQVAFGNRDAALESIQENPDFLSAPCFPGKNTLLHMVARYGQTSLLSAILQLRGQVVCSHQKGPFAAGKSDSGTISCYLDDTALTYPKTVLINAVNTKQQTPLIIAASKGHADIVQILVNEGALIQVADKAKGCTALHYAAMHGHVECVQILLGAAGLQPRGSHMTSNAFYPDRVSVASDHMENGEASFHTGQDAARRHLAFINCVNKAGATAMHLASRAGAAEVVKLLCEHGADVNAVIQPLHLLCLAFYQGTTALHIAAEEGHRSVALAILKHIYEHSDVQDPRDMLDGGGQKPHQLAFLSQHYRLAVILQPNFPLHRLFEDPDTIYNGNNVPKLAAIAAQALKRQLCSELDKLEGQFAMVSMGLTPDDLACPTKEGFEPSTVYDTAAMSSCRTSWDSSSYSYSCRSSVEMPQVFDNPLGFDAHHDLRHSRLLQSVQLHRSLASIHAGAGLPPTVAIELSSLESNPSHHSYASLQKGFDMGPTIAIELSQPLDIHLDASVTPVRCCISSDGGVCTEHAGNCPESGNGDEAVNSSPQTASVTAHVRLPQLDNVAGSTRQVAELKPANTTSKPVVSRCLFDIPETTSKTGHYMRKLSADTAECPVCYEEIDMSHMVSCQPCNHQLCVPCARHVCTAIKTKPAACPMCRANIHGFMLKTSASKAAILKPQ